MTLASSTAWTISAVALTLLAGQAIADDNPCVTGDCWDCFVLEIDSCDALFDDEDDLPLNTACANAAGDAWIACMAEGDREDINEAWNTLFERLQQCEQRFETPVAIQMCADVAWEAFKNRLEEIIDAVDQDCREQMVNPESNRASYTLIDILDSQEVGRTYENQITASVGQTVSLPNAGTGVGHDVSTVGCVRSAHLLATYRTKHGTVTEFIDHDTNVANGTPLSAYLDPVKLVHANKIILTAVFMDEHGAPVFLETGVVRIQNSPLSGDYNRDMSTDTVDLLDYIDAYGNAIPRADINEDEAIDTTDLGQFVDDFASGS